MKIVRTLAETGAASCQEEGKMSCKWLADTMIPFVRKPHRIACVCLFVTVLFTVYLLVPVDQTVPTAAHGSLMSKMKLPDPIQETFVNSGLDSNDLNPARVDMSWVRDLFGDSDTESPTQPASKMAATETTAKPRKRLWVRSQVTDKVHWLDNATLHKNPPIVPVKCNAEPKTSEMLSLAPVKFLPNYKNPCWLESIDGPLEHMYRDNGFQLYSASYKKVFHKLRGIYMSQKPRPSVRIRCLPYFFLSGQPKCGSTDLYNKLVEHPHVTTPPTKESHWWGKNRYGWCLNFTRTIPFRDYIDLYDQASLEIQSIAEDSSGRGPNFHPVITGDASVSTLWANDDWWTNPENCGLTEPLYTNAHHLHRILPWAKIIIILRNPTDRLYSDYLYFRQYKSTSDFHEVAETAIRRLNECSDAMGLRSCVYNASIAYGSRLRLRIGLYHVFLQEWLSVFPKEQILVLRLEDYANKPSETLKTVYNFLGLEQLSQVDQEKIANKPKSNTRRVGDRQLGRMKAETRDLLDDFYRPFNEKLARLLGDPSYLWERQRKS